MSTYQIQRRRFQPNPASITELPFVTDIKTGKRGKRRSFWHVPKTEDAFRASDLGIQYACDYLQYLKDNPCAVGMPVLFRFIRDMAAVTEASEKACALGFMSFLEGMLYEAVIGADHYAQAQQWIDQYAQVRRELIGGTPTLERLD